MPLRAFVRSQLEGRVALRRALHNSFWLFCDQGYRMVAGLIIGVAVARYLGPQQYGWLSYAIAAVGMVGSFTSLGVNAVVVRELVRKQADAPQILGTALVLRALGAFLGVAISLAFAWFRRGHESATIPTLIVVVALGLPLQLGDIIDLLLQARQDLRLSAWIRMASCTLSTLFRLALILNKAPVVWFAVATIADVGLSSAGWWYLSRSQPWSHRPWQVSAAIMGELLRESWPLAISGLAIYAQAYADQLVIGSALGGTQLGQYAVAIRIVSIFSFIPMVIQTVAAAEITRARVESEARYHQRLYDLYRLMTFIFLAIAVPLGLLGPFGVRLLYGKAYSGAALLLPWLTLRLLFSNFGMARSIFITNESLFRFSLVTAVAGGIVNIVLNVLLVPTYGAPGAIAASLLSFFVTTFGLDPFERQARANLRMMVQAIFAPWRATAD